MEGLGLYGIDLGPWYASLIHSPGAVAQVMFGNLLSAISDISEKYQLG